MGCRTSIAAGSSQVVIVLVLPRKIALRTSVTTSDRYDWRIRHPDKKCYGHVGQLAAIGIFPVIELFAKVV